MINMKNQPKSDTEKATYEKMFKMLHMTLIEADNKYIKSFLGVKEYVEKHLRGRVWDVQLSIHGNESTSKAIHAGRLNIPTVNEVAILLPESNVISKDHNRYITVNYKQKPNDYKQLKFIPDCHRSYDPLMYPLIFPDGADGWHDNIKLNHGHVSLLTGKRNKVTCLQHVNYQLMDRNDKFGNKIINPILFGKRLGQQYIVDSYAKVELNCLNYIKTHQKELRAELYGGGRDILNCDCNKNLNEVGKRVILPSSVTGSNR